MELQINGRNMEITERLDEYVRRKVSKLDRYLPTIAHARMDLSYENTRSAGDSQVAQLTIRGERGVILRAEERTADMFTSIDAVLDKMYRQIDRYKGKRRRSRRGAAVEGMGLFSEQALEEDEEREVVRVKRFQVVPMDQDEAIEQMELLGHDFFVFYHADEGGINVLYRRTDNNYGLLIPDLG